MKKTFGSLCLILLFVGCAANPLQKGVNAFDDGNYDTAAYYWNPLAQAGDPYAQYNLGLLLEGGLGATPMDKAAASRWYLCSARQGYVGAMVRYAAIQKESGSIDVALPWLDHAARWGNREAGTMLVELGRPVPEADLAANWMKEQSIVQQQKNVTFPKGAGEDFSSGLVRILTKKIYLHETGRLSIADDPILSTRRPPSEDPFLRDDVPKMDIIKKRAQTFVSETISDVNAGVSGTGVSFRKLFGKFRQANPFTKKVDDTTERIDKPFAEEELIPDE